MKRRILLFGRGWLGRTWAARLPNAVLSGEDIANPDAVARVLDEVGPVRVVNAAGRTGRPNVDALEGHAGSTLRSNVAGPIVLAAACHERGIHLTHLGSGCLYTGDNGGRGYGEEDPPNFHGSLYARSKRLAEEALLEFNVLQLRIRMPLSATPDPRNLLTKLLGFERVVRAPNSVTVLEDAWPAAEALVDAAATGVFNLVNDGVEYHDDVLRLWQERVDPGHAFGLTTLEDLGLRTGRSNCVLSTAKLHAAGLALPPIEARLPDLIDAYASRRAVAPR